jgi:hypothetical protein
LLANQPYSTPHYAPQTEEFYVITWEAKKEQIFEMPTGGAAIMRKGPNLLKFARKEQCMALTGQLRTKFKLEPCFYRSEGFGDASPVSLLLQPIGFASGSTARAMLQCKCQWGYCRG